MDAPWLALACEARWTALRALDEVHDPRLRAMVVEHVCQVDELIASLRERRAA